MTVLFSLVTCPPASVVACVLDLFHDLLCLLLVIFLGNLSSGRRELLTNGLNEDMKNLQAPTTLTLCFMLLWCTLNAKKNLKVLCESLACQLLPRQMG